MRRCFPTAPLVTLLLLSPTAFAAPVALQSPTSTGQQVGFEISRSIDANGSTGWAPNLVAQTAAYETVTDLGSGELNELRITFDQNLGTSHTIGKFRLSVTTADRSTFADGAGTGGNVGSPAIWTELTPRAVFGSTGGAAFTINPDNTVIAGGANPATSRYTIIADSSLSGITGIRLETFEDAALPGVGQGATLLGGPGRAANGNFVLSEFAVNATAPAANKVLLQNPTAALSQNGFPVGNLLVDDTNGWANNAGGANQAVFETSQEIGHDTGTVLTFTIDNNSGFTQHGIGKFQIQVTDADRSQFANGLENGGQIGAETIWSALRNVDVSVLGGGTATVDPTGAILISGANPNTDSYTVVARTNMNGITGLRLNALEDASLPSSGPGRFPSNGNFVVTQFSATADAAAVGAVLEVPLQNATATFSQGGFDVNNIIDGSIGTGWANFGNGAGDNTAVFETATPVNPGGQETLLTFEMFSGGFNSSHILGKFRLSATTDDPSTFADGLQNGGDVTANWVTLFPVLAEAEDTELTINPDGTILVTGGVPADNFDLYTIQALTFLENITGFRLEALTDPSLPFNGPGMGNTNGNFVVYDFSVTAQEVPEPASILTWSLLIGLGVFVARRRRRR